MVDDHKDVRPLTSLEVKRDVGGNPERVRHGRDFSTDKQKERRAPCCQDSLMWLIFNQPRIRCMLKNLLAILLAR